MNAIQLKNKTIKSVAFISDTHLNVWRKQNKFFTHVADAFQVFIDECKQRNVDLIVHAGDLFHAKEIVTTEGLLRTNAIISELSKICEVIIIPGNHDIVSKDNVEINLASNYIHFDNVYVLNEPSYITLFDKTKMYFMPFYRNIAEKIVEQTFDKDSFFVGHFGVKTFKVNENSGDYANDIAGDITAELLKDFKHCFLGHYHGYQSHDNISYISSPFQASFGDECSKHGFLFCDFGNDTCEFVENKHTPIFITVEFKKSDLKKILGISNHYIRIIVRKEVPQDLLLKIKYKLLERNFDVIIKNNIDNAIQIASSKDWTEIIFEDTETLFNNYLDYLVEQKNLPEGYSKDQLLDKVGIKNCTMGA